jgi:integrase
MRPGELDALQWDDLDFTPGNESIRIERQWNVKAKKIANPKHGSKGTIAMVEPLRARLHDAPRESEWLFTTLRGTHYTLSSCAYH